VWKEIGLGRAFAIAVMLIGLALGSGGASASSLVITINKVSQKLTVTVDGDRKYVWPVSTGAPRYETPSGTYRPFRMERDHFSEEWDDAPMPHSIFFTPQGHAIHGSPYVKSLGRRVSHGCVRLAPANAAILYALVQEAGMRNTQVIVKGGPFEGVFARRSLPRLKQPNWLTNFD
jgi:lipoprotein-anchoring transpeptidase ErfK/SrfK